MYYNELTLSKSDCETPFTDVGVHGAGAFFGVELGTSNAGLPVESLLLAETLSKAFTVCKD